MFPSHQSFVCTQSKCQRVLLDPQKRPYQILLHRVKVDLEGIAMKGHFPTLQDWSFTIRLFACVCLFGFHGISTLVGYLMPKPFLYKCGTIASRHLVGRWSRDYHMCRLVFLFLSTPTLL